MLDDEVYDIMEQLVEESRSLYEIKKYYKDDSAHCKKCVDVWKNLEEQKEENIEMLEELLKDHM